MSPGLSPLEEFARSDEIAPVDGALVFGPTESEVIKFRGLFLGFPRADEPPWDGTGVETTLVGSSGRCQRIPNCTSAQKSAMSATGGYRRLLAGSGVVLEEPVPQFFWHQ